MKVKELIEALKLFPQDSRVILSKDSEGNCFSPLPDEDWDSIGTYYPETTWQDVASVGLSVVSFTLLTLTSPVWGPILIAVD